MTTSGSYSVYEVTNIVNNKSYIGYTSRPLLVRWNEHIRHAIKNINKGVFYKAIRKYGKNNFTIKTLFTEETLHGAKETEILLILDKCPEYNSTIGGDGTHGHLITEEGRRKLREKSLGNKYNLGKKRTEQQKLHMSAVKTGCKPEKTNKFLQAVRLNIAKAANSIKKSVICIETGKIYSSAVEAAIDTNCSKSGVSRVCLFQRKKCNGLTFRYIGGGH